MYDNGSVFKQIPDNATNCLDLPDNRFQTSNVPFVILEIFIAFFISFGNILVLVAVYKFQELRTTRNIFVVNLSIADLLVGVVALPLHILLFLVPSLKAYSTLCLLRYTILAVSYYSSELTLMLISIDRYVAIHKPYQYPTLLSMSRTVSLCVLIWWIVLIYASLPLFGWNNWDQCQECSFTLVLPSLYIIYPICVMFIVLLVMTVLNGRIFLTANDKAKEIHRQTISVDTVDGRRQKNELKLFMQNTKAAKTLAFVLGLFALGNIPLNVFLLWEISILNKSEPMPPWVNQIKISASLLSLLNSGINPLIYHKRLPEFRKSFLKLLHIKPSDISVASR